MHGHHQTDIKRMCRTFIAYFVLNTNNDNHKTLFIYKNT